MNCFVRRNAKHSIKASLFYYPETSPLFTSIKKLLTKMRPPHHLQDSYSHLLRCRYYLVASYAFYYFAISFYIIYQHVKKLAAFPSLASPLADAKYPHKAFIKCIQVAGQSFVAQRTKEGPLAHSLYLPSCPKFTGKLVTERRST